MPRGHVPLGIGLCQKRLHKKEECKDIVFICRLVLKWQTIHLLSFLIFYVEGRAFYENRYFYGFVSRPAP